MAKNELEKEWESIQQSIREAGLLLFPALPEFEPVAFWPAGEDVQSFLTLAKSLGVHLVYGEAKIFGEADREEMESDLLGKRVELPNGAAKILARADSFMGRIGGIEIAWSYDGILHRYLKVAEWFTDLQEQISELQDKLAEEEEEQERTESEEEERNLNEMARRLANAPDFQQARGGELARRYVAEKLFSDLEPAELFRVAEEAWIIYRNDILPDKEREMVKEARSLMSSGLTKSETAGRLGISPKVLDGLLNRHGHRK